MLLATTAMASLTVTLNQNSYSYGEGGQFTAITSGNGTFQTFCVDTSHYFYPGHTYDYTISQNTTSPQGGNLSLGSAYLYDLFLTDALPNYTSNQKYNAGQLQYAIWALENESLNGHFIDTTGNIYYDLAVNHYGSAYNAEQDSNGAFNIGVMNLTDQNGCPAQSQLVQTAVPEPSTIVAGMLLLLPLGASMVKIARKKHLHS